MESIERKQVIQELLEDDLKDIHSPMPRRRLEEQRQQIYDDYPTGILQIEYLKRFPNSPYRLNLTLWDN